MRIIHYALAGVILSAPAINAAHAQTTDCSVTGISAEQAPPPLPEYNQPPIPAPGYLWTPGYWAWNNVDYYWVPGTWVEPPRAGLLWTPPYWGFANGAYVFHRGYWGQHVGFYGGVAYGYGYSGNGFEGGRWENNRFFYNRAVTNVRNAQITNVYNKTVIINNTRISYNGGRGGLAARPTRAEEAWAREPRLRATQMQREHLRMASTNRAAFISANHGRPTIAATQRANEFKGQGVMPARAGALRENETGRPGHGPKMNGNPAAKPMTPQQRGAEKRALEHGGPGAVPAARPNAAARPGQEKQLHGAAPNGENRGNMRKGAMHNAETHDGEMKNSAMHDEQMRNGEMRNGEMRKGAHNGEMPAGRAVHERGMHKGAMHGADMSGKGAMPAAGERRMAPHAGAPRNPDARSERTMPAMHPHAGARPHPGAHPHPGAEREHRPDKDRN